MHPRAPRVGETIVARLSQPVSVPTLCGGAWRGKWVACRFVGGYRYLSRRDEVVGVLDVGSRGRSVAFVSTLRVKGLRR
jgi:hypothetical protein